MFGCPRIDRLHGCSPPEPTTRSGVGALVEAFAREVPRRRDHPVELDRATPAHADAPSTTVGGSRCQVLLKVNRRAEEALRQRADPVAASRLI
jgi:hypothetical protein